MPIPEARTAAGRAGLAALLARPATAALAFDFDGVLSPIVADPTAAQPHPDVLPALAALGRRVGAVAIITGRPVSFLLSRDGIDTLTALPTLTVFGQYGRERWTAAGGYLPAPPDPRIDEAREAVAALLARPGADPGLWLEDKESAVAVHTRRAADPDAELAALTGPLTDLAARLGLRLEPGKLVLELRPEGTDKGAVLTAYVRDSGAGSVAYTGDDLGDLSAFAAVEALRDEGVPGITVCSGSPEQRAVADRADLVVDGPAGVADLLRTLTAAL
ncbi:trehalose-phosphatase [Actinocatenispora rupis]|uniref:Trehalose 6-phosphate phosphatase n=1 Tax=Actinocatenispora rupis TaxID=519421 RepID=A0A8J3NCZ2_9ACTN|nr:trehalose-phosphatase [Actinocatenispora rupis]GID10964.1 trehalose 6-phosphate phosphatase [Actinocatenispora rupis]